MGRRLLQSERNADLLIDVLRSLVAEFRFQLHDFVIMPDHIHLLLTVEDGMTIEKAMQYIKGRFSHRLSQESGYKGEVWQRGFTEVQVMNQRDFEAHRAYIAENPVKAGFAASIDEYPFCFLQSGAEEERSCEFEPDRQGLKPCPCYKASKFDAVDKAFLNTTRKESAQPRNKSTRNEEWQ